MEELIKKIQLLNSKLKNTNRPTKTAGAPSPDKIPSEPIINAKGPGSKKDPVKVAEQMTDNAKLKEPDTKKQAKRNKGALSYNKGGQWSLAAPGLTKDEGLEKGIKSKLAGAALVGAQMLGMGGTADKAQGDVGHIKSFMKDHLHGMQVGKHQVKVDHKDNTRKELQGSTNIGAGKFRVHVGDHHFPIIYSGLGTRNYSYKIGGPIHTESGKSTSDPLASIHDVHSTFRDGTFVQKMLTTERKPGDTRGAGVTDFGNPPKAKTK